MGVAYRMVCNGRDRAAWLKARRDGIGGSDASSVLGINPYGSALDVYADKIGAYDDDGEDDAPSDYARWGHILEPHIRNEFRRKHPDRTVRSDGRLLRSRRRPWQMTTLDGQQTRSDRKDLGVGLLEIKATKFLWDRIPPDLWCQVQHQFAVTGYRWGSFAVWNRTTCEFNSVDVEPDHDYIKRMTETEMTFWRGVQTGRPPEPAGTEACAKALNALYPQAEPGTEIELNVSFVGIARELAEAKVAGGKWMDARRRLEQEVKAAIGDFETARLPDGSSFTLKTQTRKESVSKASTFRVLRRQEAS